MQTLTPFLWFNDQAEEAMNYYTSIFKNSKTISVDRMDTGDRVIISTTFELNGQKFIALNGGPQFTFSPAISLMVNCETQDEIDYLWDRLSAGGKVHQCGWLEDKFGITWQIVPKVLSPMLQDKDTQKVGKVMAAMLKMIKLDIAVLEDAYK